MRDRFQIVCLMLALSLAGNVGLGILLSRANDEPLQPRAVRVVQLTGTQFYWRYPGTDGQFGTEDDLILPKRAAR